MNRNFLSKVPVTLVALATSASVFAGGDADSRINMLEQQMKQVRTETAVGTFGAKTASARPSNEGTDYYFIFDVLSWKAAAGGLEYAYTDTSGGGFPIEGNMKTNSFQWDWGLRAGIGYKFDYDDWEADATYTYFKAHSDERINQTLTFDVVPLKGDPTNGPNEFLAASKASSQVKIRLDNIDVRLARHYFVSKDLSFRPQFGLKNSWIQLNQDIRFEGNDIPVSKVFKDYETSKFWGIGPEVGVDSKWYLCNGFSIFGAASGSLLYGYFKVYHDEMHSSDEDTYSVNISAPVHRFVPNAQISLGLAYDKYFNDKQQHLSATLGWETIYYFRANQFLTLTDYASRRYNHISEDVSFEGVTLHLRLDF